MCVCAVAFLSFSDYCVAFPSLSMYVCMCVVGHVCVVGM